MLVHLLYSQFLKIEKFSILRTILFTNNYFVTSVDEIENRIYFKKCKDFFRLNGKLEQIILRNDANEKYGIYFLKSGEKGGDPLSYLWR